MTALQDIWHCRGCGCVIPRHMGGVCRECDAKSVAARRVPALRNAPCPECKTVTNCSHQRNPYAVGPDDFLFEAPLNVFRNGCDRCGERDVLVRHVDEFYRMCQACFDRPPPILCSDCGEELKPFDGYYRCPPCDREVRG